MSGSARVLLLVLLLAGLLGLAVLCLLHPDDEVSSPSPARPAASDPEPVRLLALSDRLHGAADSSRVASVLLDEALALTGCSRGAVLAGPEGQLLPIAVQPARDARLRAARAAPSAAVLSAQASGAPCPALADQEPWLSAVVPGAAELLVVPLRDDRAVGALVLELPPATQEPLSARLQVRADRSTVALRRAWELEQLQRLAATDGLTKIANRRTFEQVLERELARARHAAEPVGLVLLDIDRFKHLNDTYGHPAGDDVLRNVAAALSCECRDFDTAARFGGEEFVVVLPGCLPKEAEEIAERLRRAVNRAPGVVPVTASAGVACFPAHAHDAGALVRAADLALYASKDSGRDRTTSAGARAGCTDVTSATPVTLR